MLTKSMANYDKFMELDAIDQTIVRLADKGKNIKQIAEFLNMAYNSMFDRIKNLEKRKILERVKQKGKQSMPNQLKVKISLIPIEEQIEQDTQKSKEEFDKIVKDNFSEEDVHSYLSYLKLLGGNAPKFDFEWFLFKGKDGFAVRHILKLHLIERGLIEEKICLTRLGKNYLNKKD
jgi:DNA-binding MarR family transcriptional regulator